MKLIRKHGFAVRILVCALILLLPCVGAWAEENDFSMDSDGTLMGYYGSATEVIIPETIKGVEVKEIGYSAFDNNKKVTSITLPSTVTVIGQYAFRNCTSLKSITIPDSVETIEYYAFSNCSSMESVFADSLEGWLGISISTSASPLDGDAQLYIDGEKPTEIVIPEGITTIRDYAFEGCSDLSSVTFPKGLTAIGKGAFSDCTALTRITLPDTLVSLGGSAFEGCSKLYSVSIPDSVTDMSSYVFYECSGLQSVKLSASCKYIPGNAFGYCSSLASITIPEEVTTINSRAFFHCGNLKTLRIPASVKKVYTDAFYGSYIKNTYIDSLESWLNLYLGNKWANPLGHGTSALYINGVPAEYIVIPDGVTSLRDYAFYRCSNVKSITIPATITSIGEDAMYECDGLEYLMFLGNEVPEATWHFSQKPTICCYEYSNVDYWAAENGYRTIYLDTLDGNTPIDFSIPGDFRLEVGKSSPLVTSFFPASDKVSVQWTSSAPNKVSVTDGIATAHAAGTVRLTASVGNISKSLTVTAYVPLESFELSRSELWIISKETGHVGIKSITPKNASTSFTWKSTNTSVLTVDSTGHVTAKAPGTATVIVASDNGINRECIVHVCYPVTAIEFDAAVQTALLGKELQLRANVTARDESFVNKLVTFTSSDARVASVNANGLVTCISEGTATITATAASGVSAKCSVIVRDAFTPSEDAWALPADLLVISEEAFMNVHATEIVIPDGCKSIGGDTFKGCADLAYVFIPDSVTEIADDAFEDCSNLTIVCGVDSTASEFAQKNSIPCIAQ